MSIYDRADAAHLRQSLNSLAGQSVPANELVLVEDGPLNRELADVIESFRAELRIRSVKLPTNAGLGAALRAGLMECRGQFVARMDGDDVCVHQRFEKQLAYLSTHPYIDVLGSAIAEFDDELNAPNSTRMLPAGGEELAGFARYRNPLNHMTVMFRKASVLGAGSYLPCQGYEDYYLWARMLMRGCRFHNLGDTLVWVRGGIGMQGRRGGLDYIRHEISAQRMLRALGFLTLREFLRNILIRVPVRLIPGGFRALFYRMILRQRLGGAAIPPSLSHHLRG